MKEGWEYKKLGEVGLVVTGSTPSTKESENYNSRDYCFVKPGDIPKTGISVLIDSEFYISTKAYNSSRKLPKGSVLTTCIGIIGKVGILGVDATCNQQINAIIPNPDIVLSHFLAYSILSHRKKLEKKANAPIVPIINKKDFSNIIIEIPSISEQQRIVEDLDLLSSIIEKKKEQLKELDNLAQSTFYDMFGDPIANEKGWVQKQLKEVAEIVGGGTPKTNVEEYWDGTNYWITPAEIGENRYVDKTERKITDLAVSKTNLCQMPTGTVLLSSRAPIGKVCITKVPMYCNQGFKNVVCSSEINNEYICQLLMSEKDYLQSLGTGATFKEISKKTTEGIRIPVPSLSLQQQFASKVEAIEKQKELIKQSIKEVETLFNSRMDYYFN